MHSMISPNVEHNKYPIYHGRFYWLIVVRLSIRMFKVFLKGIKSFSYTASSDTYDHENVCI